MNIIQTLQQALVVLALIPAAAESIWAEQQQLLMVGQPATSAIFQSCDEQGTLHFLADGKSLSIPMNQLVRWSQPIVKLSNSELILADGSRIVIAESWTGLSSIKIDDSKVSISTKFFGDQAFPRHQLQGLLINPPADLTRKTRLRDQLAKSSDQHDRLFLTNQDILIGKLQALTTDQIAGRTVETFAFTTGNITLNIPINRVLAISLGNTQEIDTRGNLLIGLSDGSLLEAISLQSEATSLQSIETEYKLNLTTGTNLNGSKLTDIVLLQSLSSATYLSALNPLEYHHQPYLDLTTPYQRDRNLFGGPLKSHGSIYSKGIAMPSSSRLTFEIPRKQNSDAFSRFSAHIALDDSASRGGSVIFKVLQQIGDDWQTAFTSPILRGGEQPQPVTLELNSANQIALVVESADRGDELDYANWLDARLE